MGSIAAPSQSLTSKIALVTGSSSGIGEATALELSKRGAYIVVSYYSPAEQALAEGVLAGLPTAANSIIVQADLSTWDGPRKLAAIIKNRYGHLNILVNSAAYGGMVPFDTPDDELLSKTWDATFNTNARGTYLLIRAVLPFLSHSNSRIVNITSDTVRDPPVDSVIYAGTKGMIEVMTRCLARELPRKLGCTVNAVAPGPVATAVMKSAPPEFMESVKHVLDRTPVGSRMGEPEELAWMIATLCEPGASWVNGQVISVNGGSVLR